MSASNSRSVAAQQSGFYNMHQIKLTNFGRTKKNWHKESPKCWGQKTRNEWISICTSRRLSNHTVECHCQTRNSKTHQLFFANFLFLLFCVFPLLWKYPLINSETHCLLHCVRIIPGGYQYWDNPAPSWSAGSAALQSSAWIGGGPHWTDCKWVLLSRSQRDAGWLQYTTHFAMIQTTTC